MRGLLLVACLLATAPSAQTIAGADDPAFRAPFDRALQGDDPTALAEVRAQAEAGNLAALRALPAMLVWLPPQGALADKALARTVNGASLDTALAAASPVAPAWDSGRRTYDPVRLHARIRTLFDAGEPGKASVLLSSWIDQYTSYSPIPLDLLDTPAPAYALGSLLAFQLLFHDDPADDARLATRLRGDRLEAWIAMATLVDIDATRAPDLRRSARIAAIFTATGLAPDDPRLQDAAMIGDLIRSTPSKAPVTMAETVARLLRGRPEFLPVESFCNAACPQTAAACEVAWLQAFRHPFGARENAVPETALISTEAFFATPRGAKALFPSDLDVLQRSGHLEQTLRHLAKTDSCLAAQVRSHQP